MNTSTSLKVQASYADGSSNTIRPTGLVHPDGAELDSRYGPSGSIDDAASRMASLAYGGDEVTAYQDLGQGTVVEVGYPQPELKYTLIGWIARTECVRS